MTDDPKETTSENGGADLASENLRDPLDPVVEPKATAASWCALTANIIDSDGVAWKFAAYTFTLVNIVGGNPVYLEDGTLAPLVLSGFADGNGALAVNVPRNDKITPAGTQWELAITGLATNALSTQLMTFTTPALAITLNVGAPRFVLNGTNYGYDDREVIQPVFGALGLTYFNTTTYRWRAWAGGATFTDSGLPTSDATTPNFTTMFATGTYFITNWANGGPPGVITQFAVLQVWNIGGGYAIQQLQCPSDATNYNKVYIRSYGPQFGGWTPWVVVVGVLA